MIIITTKTGKSGDLVVNYSNNFSTTTPTTRTDFISDPYLYGKTVDAALFGYNGTIYTGYNDEDYEIIQEVANGTREPFHELQPDGTYKFYHQTDWYDYLLRNGSPPLCITSQSREEAKRSKVTSQEGCLSELPLIISRMLI